MKIMIPNMAVLFKKIYPGEIITAIVVLSIVNYFYYPEDPGLLHTGYNPYFIIIIFFSCFYGKISGIIALLVSITGIVINFAVINYKYDIFGGTEYFIQYFFGINYNEVMQFLFMSFIFAVLFGEIRDTLGVILNKHKNKIEELEEKENKLDRELKAISMVNEEYQDRILGQQNSLISLYSTMISLNSLDMEKIYPNILEAIVKFSGAGKCSLWQYNREEKALLLLATHGWSGIKAEDRKISDSDNITGWVARNNAMFSVKLLQKHANLLEIDKKNNIITVPVNIGNLVWGIINIEEMPFVKYNLYSEQLIMMIADLAAPIIGNAIRFDEISRKGEVDEVTGLPSIDEMFSALKEEFGKAFSYNTKLSFVVFELSNSEELLEKYSGNEVLELLRTVAQLVKRESKKDAMIFQYKGRFQFSLILPNMDYDGAAMLCLTFIEKINSEEFKIGEISMHPEIILGYSSMRPNLKSEEDIMMLAENLLEMQKI
ncbi:MAG: diguanylate cyclase [Spirochaetota bacterium]